MPFSSGFAPWSAFEALPGMVRGRPGPSALLFLYDLKCMDPAKHRELTGADNGRILDNLLRLDAAGARIWIRCPLAPGLNDSDADLAALRAFLATLRHAERVEICPYHPLGLGKYAIFGMTAAYPRQETASPADVRRYHAALPNVIDANVHTDHRRRGQPRTPR